MSTDIDKNIMEKSIELDYVKDSGDYIASSGGNLIDSCDADHLESMIERLIKIYHKK